VGEGTGHKYETEMFRLLLSHPSCWLINNHFVYRRGHCGKCRNVCGRSLFHSIFFLKNRFVIANLSDEELACSAGLPSDRGREWRLLDPPPRSLIVRPEISCRYCYKKGHRVRDCEEVAAARAAKALRSSRPASSRAAAAAPRVHPPPPKPAAPARQSCAPVVAPPGRTSVPLTASVASAAAAAAASMLAAPSLETEQSLSAIAAHAAAADRTTPGSMDASVRAVSGDPSSSTFAVDRAALKKRACRSGTADEPEASATQPDDMVVNAGSISFSHDPSSMESDSADPLDGGGH
jgi:hypothetical protein